MRLLLVTLPLKPHFNHLLREESLMGFRGKYQTKASDSQTADHFMPPILFPGCYVTYATVCTVTQEGKVCWAQLQCNLLVRETMAKFQSAFMVRIADSWRPQSPAVSACVKHNCSVAFWGLWHTHAPLFIMFITQKIWFYITIKTKLNATHQHNEKKIIFNRIFFSTAMNPAIFFWRRL